MLGLRRRSAFLLVESAGCEISFSAGDGSRVAGARGFFPAGGEERFEGFRDRRWNEWGDFSTEACDFFNEARREEGRFLTWRKEQGLNLWGESSIHQCHLELVFEVGHCAESADEGRCTGVSRELNEQAIEGRNFDGL